MSLLKRRCVGCVRRRLETGMSGVVVCFCFFGDTDEGSL